MKTLLLVVPAVPVRVTSFSLSPRMVAQLEPVPLYRWSSRGNLPPPDECPEEGFRTPALGVVVPAPNTEGSSRPNRPLHIGRHAQMMATFCSIIVQVDDTTSYVGSGLVDEKSMVCMRRMLVMVTLMKH